MLLLLMALFPTRMETQSVYNLMAVVDITRSMNAEDYQRDGKPISRLEFVKRSLRELAASLPCQSKLGIGVFTERRSSILFEPIEVCAGYSELDKAIAALDWRMAWAADSRIASGLLNTLQLLSAKDTNVLFMTDGQEAPPLNSRYKTDFSGLKGKVKGLIVGAGDLQAVAIPKFDQKGQRIGVYGPDDVPHRSSFGESDLNPEKIEGYDARNAPFGKQAAIGNEHQSALQENYLQQLAAESGLAYHRLQGSDLLYEAVKSAEIGSVSRVASDIRAYFIVMVLVLIVVIFI
ncbi:MAG: MxaL protein [Methylomonas sp.]|nr:MAG: MxaL protein [Methylomonas sp.]